MGRRHERGASGLMIVVVLVLLAVAIMAARVLSRLGDSADDKKTTLVSLERARKALDQFVAAAGANARLPCPADPAQDTGLEDTTCSSKAGSVPWKTIGLRRDDAYDAWGRKLSYRVYMGNKGDLTQAGGPAMLDCNYDPNFPDVSGTGATPTGGCKADHTTTQFDFLGANGKGLKLYDFGTEFSSATNNPVAFVVFSAGPTGGGGYTVSGVQLDTHAGTDEKKNMNATGDFYAEAWSSPDIASTDAQHFDDLVVYRTIKDLAFIAGITGRKWIVPVTTTTFDAATVNPALASAANPAVVDFGAVTASGFAGASSASLASDTTNSLEGLGVGGGFDNQISSTAFESIKLSLDRNKTAKSMAITLNNFGTYIFSFFGTTYTYTEQAQFTFYRNNSTVDTKIVGACGTGQGQETFVVVPSGDFDSVQIKPLSAVPSPTFFSGDTSFSIAAFATCTSTGCGTGVSTATTCP